jgi:hypothetical protein
MERRRLVRSQIRDIEGTRLERLEQAPSRSHQGNTQITIHSSLEKDLAGIWGAKRLATHPLTGKAVDVKVHVFGQITLDDGTPVIETIKEIKTGVADTLRQFEPDF